MNETDSSPVKSSKKPDQKNETDPPKSLKKGGRAKTGKIFFTKKFLAKFLILLIEFIFYLFILTLTIV